MNLQLALGAFAGAILTIFVVMAGLAFLEPGEYGVPAPLYNLLKDIVGPVAAGFGGAISGAFVSYRYQQDNERRQTLREEGKSYNRAMGLLAYKLNDIASIKTSAILPYENHSLRFIIIPAMPHSQAREERATDTLSDILIGRGEEDLLPLVFEAEEMYHSARESFFQRVQLISEMREKTEAAEEGSGRLISLEIMVSIHGAGATIRMYRLTEQVIVAIDDSIDQLINALEILGQRCGSKLKRDGLATIAYSRDENDAYRRVSPPYFASVDQLDEWIKNGAGHKGSIYSHSSQRPSYRY